MICESSRLVYLHVGKGLPERGWPLLYKLFDKFYVIGLYSYPHTSDSLLLSDHLVQRFRASEGKHCGTEQIASVDVSEAALEMEVPVRNPGKLQDLLEEFREVQAEGESEDIAEVEFRIGLQYGSLGNFPQEKEYYLSALQRYLSCGHPQPLDSIAALYHNLGICESELGDNSAARLHLGKSLSMKKAGEGEGEGESIADTYNQLGVVCRKEGRPQQALEYYYKAYRIYNQMDYSQKMGIVLNNINLLTQEDQTHSASEAKYRGIIAVLARTRGSCIEVAEVLFNLGQMEAGCRNYGTAITHFAKAVSVMKNLGLQEHCQYGRMVRAVEEVGLRVRESGERKQWQLKSKALLDML